MTDLPNPPDRETADCETWLKRANLTIENLLKLKPAEIARVGRQWSTYQTQVKSLLAETSAERPEDIRFGWLETRIPKV